MILMGKKSFKNSKIKDLLLVFIGFLLGSILIWPGLTSIKGRNCFVKILKDGGDGNIKLSTVLSIDPKYLIKIKNARNNYYKLLFVGDHCFRK